ncbi:MAG: hypothetical protein ACI88L_000413 [Candidatus Paceibacteria bacterium]|jgi:hypothetical protein
MALAKITKEKVLAEIAIMGSEGKNVGSVDLGVMSLSITKNGTKEATLLEIEIKEGRVNLYDTFSSEAVDYLVHSNSEKE